MLIQKLLFSLFKKKVESDWRNTKITKNMEVEYKRLKPIIEKCYTNVTNWHGTGRYHYSTIGNSKYEEVNTNKVVDVLRQILENHGLKPHEDPWVQIDKQYSSSISTTPWRMYARTYVELHMPEGENLSTVYGKREDIIKFFFYYTLLSTPLKAFIKSMSKSFDKKELANKGPVWAKTINSKFQSKGNAYSDFLYILGKGNSDIKNNYGILIGLRVKHLKTARINPIIKMFETRFTEKMRLKDISHFEVPWNKVEKTKLLLNKYKVDIPVLPIEVCEFYNSKNPIRFSSNKITLPSFTKEEYIQHYRN